MTNRAAIWILALAAAAAAAAIGCSLRAPHQFAFGPRDLASYQAVATEIEYPDADAPECGPPNTTAAPITMDPDSPPVYWDLSLQDVIRMTLAHSIVLRDLGGMVLPSPQNVRTVDDPSIVETDPRFGVEAALSAFDAAFETKAFFDKIDRPINNLLFLNGQTFRQDLAAMQWGLSKRAASGTQMTLRNTTDYDNNNTPGNPLPNSWVTRMEAEVRHPLLRGGGVEFNRLAGPDAIPGFYNGVLIARVNTDISLAEFEIAVRNLLADVETQYWELYFAYRDLDAKLDARNRALETWRRIHALYETGRVGGEAEKEAQAREQYFRLEEEAQNALSGRQFQKSRTIAFAFRGNNGVHANERELRLLMGIPINDGRLIRPADEPLTAKTIFDWDELLSEALVRRAELRRQKWRVKRREMELAASRNFLYPQLDVLGRYRWLGLGQDLINSTRQTGRFDNAYQNLTSGDFQEWQLGFEFSFPVGYRQGHAAVRNAQLQLSRAKAVLREQERDVTHDLASALAEMERAYAVAQTNYNRRIAASQQLAALEATYDDADENQKTRLLDLILDAQRRLADAESRYYRALSEYTMGVSQVHFQKGALLEYDQVFLAEGPWPGKAHADAAARRLVDRPGRGLCNYVLTRPPCVSRGPVPQGAAAPCMAAPESEREGDSAPEESPPLSPTESPPPARVTRLPPLVAR